ncbi:hypothetical protein K469DRAFT_697399 [Zopfia rhizophila CBS 207.26]|uniref:J domain-containing protein n=1 Tax=Zopfia rhizophila CBS 207.26 TaxID=1314779 RepID=A0A6A6DDK7_9PEZI|nr:hypothetical protein K469DRAFT_697399 [Zopfia rhizophila CBS 207.26]
MDHAQPAPLLSSLYLSSASASLSRKPPRSARTPNISHATAEFVNHYAVMGLDIWASYDDIVHAHRKLRAEYFKTDAGMYRKLQAAFDLLADREARSVYDKQYRTIMGVQPPLPLPSCENENDNALALAIEEDLELSPAAPATGTAEMVHDEQGFLADKQYESEVSKKVKYIPVIGTRPYHSYIPIHTDYTDRATHPRMLCARPKYVLVRAKLSKP